MAEDEAFDLTQIPQTLELIKVVSPRNSELIVAGSRMFVPSVEFWNVRTTIRIVWPVYPHHHGGRPSFPTVVDQDGVEYGLGGAGGSGDGIVWDGYLTTERPVPLDVRSLTVTEDVGTYTLDF